MKFLRRLVEYLAPQRRSLGARVLQAGGWSMVQILTTNILRLATNLIMTRYLVPEAFGLMALVATLITAFNLLTDIGLSQSISRDAEGDKDHFLRVAWTIKLMRGSLIAISVLLVALLLWLLGPSLAPKGSIYTDSRLPALLALSSFVPLMIGAESTAQELALRRLQNSRYTVIGITAHLSGVVSMLVFVQMSPTVWALIFGMLTINLVALIATHIFYPGPTMKLIWDTDITNRLWNFGKFLMGSSIFTFVARSADRFILAGLLGPTTFSLYAISLIWIEAGTMLIERLANHVGFPAMSEVIRTRPYDLPRLFRKFQNFIDILCLSSFFLTFFLSSLVIDFLYSGEFENVGSYLTVLSVSFLILRFEMFNTLILNLGNSYSIMIISSIRAIAVCILVPTSLKFLGFTGALLAVALTPAITAPYSLILLRKILGKRQILYGAAWIFVSIAVGIAIYIIMIDSIPVVMRSRLESVGDLRYI